MCIICGNDNCMEEAIGLMVRNPERDKSRAPRAPIQQNTLGVAGYKKPVRLYDPRNPNVEFADPDEETTEEEAPQPVLQVKKTRVRETEE